MTQQPNPADVLQILQGVGWAHLGGFESLAATRRFIRQCGRILGVTDVKVEAHKPGLIYTSREVPFHTDAPAADIVVWYCMVEGRPGETLVTVDIAELLADYSAADFEALARVRCNLPPTRRGNNPHPMLIEHGKRPLVELTAGRARFNYTYCLEFEAGSAPDLALAQDVRERIENRADDHAVSHMLRRGDVFLLDNRRFLHSRAALDPQSPRCHRRFWMAATATLGMKLDRGHVGHHMASARAAW